MNDLSFSALEFRFLLMNRGTGKAPSRLATAKNKKGPTMNKTEATVKAETETEGTPVFRPKKKTGFKPKAKKATKVAEPKGNGPVADAVPVPVPVFDKKTGQYAENLATVAKQYADAEKSLLAPPYNDLQRAKWKLAMILEPARKQFDPRVEKCKKDKKPAPGSWPHYCRTELGRSEKFFSKWKLALDYAKSRCPEMLAKIEDEKTVVIPLWQAARLQSLNRKMNGAKGKEKEAVEQTLNEIHAKAFAGEYKSADDFEAEFPKSKSKNQGGPKAYELGSIRNGAMGTLAQAIKSFPQYERAIWTGDAVKGSIEVQRHIQKTLKNEFHADENSEICFLVWVKE